MTPSAATIEIIEQRLSRQADTKARRPMVKIAVAGGTGLVGRQTVEAVRCHGHDPLVLTRSAGVDLTTGAGLAAPLDGADAVIDVTNTPGVDASQVRAFFATVGGTCWPPSTPRSSAIM
jgi:NAD(P)-dependent dehydrogenase (short-subunit alcohol dehydrogenase family)